MIITHDPVCVVGLDFAYNVTFVPSVTVTPGIRGMLQLENLNGHVA